MAKCLRCVFNFRRRTRRGINGNHHTTDLTVSGLLGKELALTIASYLRGPGGQSPIQVSILFKHLFIIFSEPGFKLFF